MHYKNGREAHNGDKVLYMTEYGVSLVGILYDTTPGSDYCNGRVATISPSDCCPNLGECLHIDDVKSALTAMLAR